MIDKNKDCVTKSKLTTTVKTSSKYNDWSRLTAKQTNKQTNRLRDTEASKNLGRKRKTYLQIDTQADLDWIYAHTEVSKKLKMKPCVLLLLK